MATDSPPFLGSIWRKLGKVSHLSDRHSATEVRPMNLRLVPIVFLLVACALVPRVDPAAKTPVGVRSHNASDVEV